MLGVGSKKTEEAVARERLPEERYRVLIEAQRGGDVSNGVRTLYQFASERVSYWPTIFAWAIAPKDVRSRYHHLVGEEISEKDKQQIDLDLPRTMAWLRHKSKTNKDPNLSSDSDQSSCEDDFGDDDDDDDTCIISGREKRVRFEKLRRVLHAYGASVGDVNVCTYVQGMNGIAFVLLQVLDDDEMDAFSYLHGICQRLLPGLFDGTSQDDFLGQDNMGRMAEFFDDLIKEFYPQAADMCENAGIPVGTLALKWMLTLFSNLSFSGGDDTLQYDTILAAWDICFLMGMAGVSAVVVALFGFAAPKITNLSNTNKSVHMEHLISAFKYSLRKLPDSMLYNACAELLTEDSIHPKIRTLKEAHERKVKRTEAKLRRKLSYNMPSLEQPPNQNQQTKLTPPQEDVNPTGSTSWLAKISKKRIHPESHVYDGTPRALKEITMKQTGDEDELLPLPPKVNQTSLDTRIEHQHRVKHKPPPSHAYLKEWTSLRDEDDMKQEQDELTFAHQWIEAIDPETKAKYYYNARNTSQILDEPPPQGYVTSQGLLMLPKSQK